jgi:3-(methylthio)propionyl---CoA ligase
MVCRYTYVDAASRSKQLANAISKLGVGIGDRVCTIAWNGFRHFELYYGVSGKGAVLHTVNPRLHPDQITYVINHAENKLLFVDLTFFPAVEKLLPTMKTISKVVVMTDRAHMPATTLSNVICYEDMIAGALAFYTHITFPRETS